MEANKLRKVDIKLSNLATESTSLSFMPSAFCPMQLAPPGGLSGLERKGEECDIFIQCATH